MRRIKKPRHVSHNQKEFATICILILMLVAEITCDCLSDGKPRQNSSQELVPKNEAKDNSAQEWAERKDYNDHRAFHVIHRKCVIFDRYHFIIHRFRPQRDIRTICSRFKSRVIKSTYPTTLDRKITLFHRQMDESARIKATQDKFHFVVNRSNILQDSYEIVMSPKGPENLKKILDVGFENEYTSDPEQNFTEHWFSLLSNEISDPENNFFQYADEYSYELEINPYFTDTNYFEFIGRLVGAAVYHRMVVNIHLVKPYYKIMLSKPIELEDVKSCDPVYYKNLTSSDESLLKDYVSDEHDVEGKSKAELIGIIIQDKYEIQIRNQMSAFLSGFADLIPLHFLSLFTADELKLVIGGTRAIDVDDWRKNTQYGEGLNQFSPVVRWFWKIVTEFNDDQRSRLLKYATESSRPPAKGFAKLSPKFTINGYHEGKLDTNLRLTPEMDLIPGAAVCANAIILSEYSSLREMRKKLSTVIEVERS